MRLLLVFGLFFLVQSSGIGEWYSKKGPDGRYRIHNDARGPEAVQLRGLSMTGFETGTRGTNAGGGYWLFDPPSPSPPTSLQIVRNVVTTLAKSWNTGIIRMPICGSAWLQNYNVRDWGNEMIANYHDWVDNAVNTATQAGVVVIIDVHLWAIAPETNQTRDSGLEDGCTGINKVCVGVPSCVDSCAPHDWYGQYTSARTGKTYNQGDDVNNWQCAIANADGCTLDNIKRGENLEHFLNLWYDLSNHYKNNTNVWFELFNEPYQRESAKFNDPACQPNGEGTSYMCPPNTGFGDNLDETDYDWDFWSTMNDQAISTIRGNGANNMILVTGLDWNYDYLGKGGSTTGGPIARPSLMPWVSRGVQNVGYAMHPYQHGACCGAIGSTSDLSATDPYQSAFCQFPASTSPSNSPLPISANVTAGAKTCDSTGYATTQDKKAPPCIWVANAIANGVKGVCAGDQQYCKGLSQSACQSTDWSSANAGGWSSYVLPMQKYGPLVATEFGPFDCSSPFTTTFLKWCKQYDVSYTAWALWPQNSGGPGSGACGYPSAINPTGGPLDASCAFGKCSPNCVDLTQCSSVITPMGWSGTAVYNDIKGTFAEL